MSTGRSAGGGKHEVVLGAADRVGENRPGLVDASHALGFLDGALVQIGVVALRQPPMGACHLERRRIARHAQDGVWI